MIRFALFAALSAGVAMPVAAQSKKDRFCEELAYASQQLADLRIGGSDETEAMLSVAGQYEEGQVNHLQMMPYLSSFVYGLSDEQLKGDVEGAFAEQCKGFKG
ncbi:hypothetical protein [Planktotalea arctica]|uniref:hypothetical protein n=1 Tax=Planktotalea arctica TaxID=1481893 RepID=UPI000A1779E3|nr:hypothetical protein [Planktotalea arctica]